MLECVEGRKPGRGSDQRRLSEPGRDVGGDDTGSPLGGVDADGQQRQSSSRGSDLVPVSQENLGKKINLVANYRPRSNFWINISLFPNSTLISATPTTTTTAA